MATIISLANQKGGVGKTTTAFNLGCALQKLGTKVLLVDNDPQCNLTSYATFDHDFVTTTDDFYVTRRKPLENDEIVQIADSLWLLPGDDGLVGAEFYLHSRHEKEFVLRQALQKISPQMDFILIDNPPALNLLTVNGMVAASGVVVPVQLEFFSLEGLVYLQRTLASLQIKNPGLKLLGIIPNMFNDRRRLNCEVLKALEAQFSEVLFKTRIHDSVKIAESTGHGQSVLSYAPNSRSATEYLDLAREIMDHV